MDSDNCLIVMESFVAPFPSLVLARAPLLLLVCHDYMYSSRTTEHRLKGLPIVLCTRKNGFEHQHDCNGVFRGSL
jgi:hypothetical protein